MTTPYITGTVSVTAGSATVTGNGTGWDTSGLVAGILGVDGLSVPVLSIDSDTSLTLAKPWPGPTASGKDYWITYDTEDGQQTVGLTQLVAEYVARLAKPFFAALSGLTPTANTLPYFGAGAVGALAALTSTGRDIIGAGDKAAARAAIGAGSGNGDFVGPTGGVTANQFVGFADATGKVGKGLSLSEARAAIGGLPIAGFISPNFNLSNNASDAANDINFPSGVVASSAEEPLLMSHASAVSQLDVLYGSGNGGRFDAAISDGTWHCFVISNGTTVSRGFSKSIDPTTQPNYPTGYTYYRRVGSIRRVSGAIAPFIQRDDYFEYSNRIVERDSSAAQATTLLTLSVPTGIVVQPVILSQQQQNVAGNCSTRYASPGGVPLAYAVTSLAGEITNAIIPSGIFTNTSGQVQFDVVFFSGTLSVNYTILIGWTDKRGR